MKELTEEQTAVAERLPAGFWNRITFAMFRAHYSEHDEILEVATQLCSYLADEIDIIQEAEDTKATDYVKDIIKPKQMLYAFTTGTHETFPIGSPQFCCKAFEEAAMKIGGEDVALAFKGFRSDLNGDTWFAECPYCGAELILNEEGMIVGEKDK